MKPGTPTSRQNLVARNRFVATAVTVVVGGLLILSGRTMSLWKIFGSANQLLAALAMMAVTVWLGTIRKKTVFTLVPMVAMYVVTVCALVLQLVQVVRAPQLNVTLLVLVVLLLVLSGLLAYNYGRHRMRHPDEG